jgi:hypothetical protein
LERYAASGKFSHDNYFHSVLRMLSIKTTAYDAGLDVLQKCVKG